MTFELKFTFALLVFCLTRNMVMRELAPQLHIPWSIPMEAEDIPIVPTTSGTMYVLKNKILDIWQAPGKYMKPKVYCARDMTHNEMI